MKRVRSIWAEANAGLVFVVVTAPPTASPAPSTVVQPGPPQHEPRLQQPRVVHFLDRGIHLAFLQLDRRTDECLTPSRVRPIRHATVCEQPNKRDVARVPVAGYFDECREIGQGR